MTGFVVVANRLPASVTDRGWQRSPGGLVNALEPALRNRDGVWIGWAGVADARLDPFDFDGIRLHPVPLSGDDVRDFYEGFANSTLWPLYHDAVVAPAFHRHWWDRFVAVNRRFAGVAAELAAPGGTVWIHDYQLHLAPAMLRALRPDLRIGFFLHIPFPPAELFMNGVKRAVLDALAEPEDRRRCRMAAMRRRVFEHDVDHWAKSFLHALDVDDQPAITA